MRVPINRLALSIFFRLLLEASFDSGQDEHIYFSLSLSLFLYYFPQTKNQINGIFAVCFDVCRVVWPFFFLMRKVLTLYTFDNCCVPKSTGFLPVSCLCVVFWETNVWFFETRQLLPSKTLVLFCSSRHWSKCKGNRITTVNRRLLHHLPQLQSTWKM